MHITPTDFARRLGCTPKAICIMVRDSIIPPTAVKRVGRRILIDADALADLLRSGTLEQRSYTVRRYLKRRRELVAAIPDLAGLVNAVIQARAAGTATEDNSHAGTL